MTTVSDKDYDGEQLLCRYQCGQLRRRTGVKYMLTVQGIKEQIKKVMKQPQYDDGSAGPVFVR